MDYPMTPDSASKHQSLYKLASPVSWKENYKRRCADRLKQSRAKLLDRYRKLPDAISAVEDVMSDELVKIQQGVSFIPNSAVDFDDVLKCMDEIKTELLEWESEVILNHEHETIHADINNDPFVSDAVICPICKMNYLEVQYGFVQCKCGVNIPTDQDGIGLKNVKMWLEDGVATHAKQCLAPSVFSVVTNFGSKNLLITCSACDFMFIVV